MIYNANYSPQSKEEVEKATSSYCREIDSDEQRSFLRCQLGVLRPVRGTIPIFVLHAYGPTWAETYKMWRKRKLSSLSRE